MYAAHFHLRELPFSIAPDPSFLYMSARHQEALGHLLYGTGKSGGFVQLTGEVGTGKTTIVRTLLSQKLDDVDVAMIHNPRQSELEFMASLCDELQIRYPSDPTLKGLVDALNLHLLQTHAAGRRTVLIIDEAQNLPPSVLEQVRLLTNLETDKEKLLRILLVGQPELDELLARPDLRQLASRITARYHLLPLSLHETREYIRHRLRVAGGHVDIFTLQAIDRVHRLSGGNPRQINILSDRALLGTYSLGARQVTPEIVQSAARETMGIRGAAAASKGGGFVPRVQGLLGRVSLLWVEGSLALLALLVLCVLLIRMFADPAKPRTAALQPAPVVTQPQAQPVLQPSAPIAVATSPTETPAGTTAPENTAASRSEVSLSELRQEAEPLSQVVNRLVRLWDSDVRIAADENVCEALAKRRLGCYRSLGAWPDLEQLDRPAILTLDLGGADHQYVLLRYLTPTDAILDGAHGRQSLPRERLDDLWTGEFMILWRREIDSDMITQQTRGAPVLWLRRQLARAANKSEVPVATNDRGRFDDQLAGALRQFQTEHGLLADGVAGTRTLIALSNLVPAPGTPMLSEVQIP